ncbi:gag-pol fusion protein [Pelomyxa schiedti]|nr:gag-pol fusion protein [Pelomyxa schiedti]
MSLDFVGPLRATRRGNSYILVMIDHLTGDVELKATRHPDAESAVRALVHSWVCRKGIPRVMISDRGTHFTNRIMTGPCSMLGIEQRMTTPYHPQADGKTERTPGALLDYSGAGEAHRQAEKLTRRVCEAWKLAQRTAELTKQTWDSSRKPHIEHWN